MHSVNAFGEVAATIGWVVMVLVSVIIVSLLFTALLWTLNFLSMCVGLAYTVLKHPKSVKDGYSKIGAVVGLAARSAASGKIDLQPRREPVRFVYNNFLNWKLIDLSNGGKND